MRKKRLPKEGKAIKIKSQPVYKKTMRNKILKHIREEQEKNYKKLFDETTERHSTPSSSLPSSEKSDFENSIEYMKTKVEEKSVVPSSLNMTIKNHRSSDQEYFTPFNTPHQPVTHHPSIHQGYDWNPKIPPPDSPHFQIKPPPPKYGCLKNGQLPTYRNYMQMNSPEASNGSPGINPGFALFSKTRKHYPSAPGFPPYRPQSMTPVFPPTQGFYPNDSTASEADGSIVLPNQMIPPPPPNSFNLDVEPNKNHLNLLIEKKKVNQLIENAKSHVPKNLKYLKQKKTFKRTYYLGKSNKLSKIGVLVSNRTIRKERTTQAHLLKQVDINTIKKFLIKKGFVTVGTTAPNDVLRQMYENVHMIGGDVYNHNPENLLYNYLHE